MLIKCFKLLNILQFSTHFICSLSLPPLSVFFLHLLEIVLSAAPGEIFAPSLFHTVKNETILFSCDAVGINAFWGINSSTVNDEGETVWTEKGFTFHKNVMYDPMGNEHFHHNTLQMVSHVDRNNTVITCAALDTSHVPLRSDTITVIIMGKLIFL